MKSTAEVLAGVRDSLSGAANAFADAMGTSAQQHEEYRKDRESLVAYLLGRAFLELRLFLEAKGMLEMLRTLAVEHDQAAEDFMKHEVDDLSGEPYSFWTNRLDQYATAIDTSFGEGKPTTVTKDLIEILRHTTYSITRPCFGHLPTEESEVHDRINAILSCLFRDLVPKPRIWKPIGSFIPDAGIPSLRTLIEYKFVASETDVRRARDELLTDSRGYESKDWDRLVFVIYETKPLMPEDRWKQDLAANGIGHNTHVVVLTGALPTGDSTTTGAMGRKPSLARDSISDPPISDAHRDSQT